MTFPERPAHDPRPYERLLALAGRTTVGVRAAPGSPDTRLWGSGVLVAPGWVLTCAHVLADHGRRRPTGPDGEIGCLLSLPPDGPRPGVRRVVAARPEYDLTRPSAGAARDPADRPDLALLRLLDDQLDHPCAWLGDQAGALLTYAVAFRGHLERGAPPPSTAAGPAPGLGAPPPSGADGRRAPAGDARETAPAGLPRARTASGPDPTAAEPGPDGAGGPLTALPDFRAALPRPGEARGGEAPGGGARNADVRNGDVRDGDVRNGDVRDGEVRGGEASPRAGAVAAAGAAPATAPAAPVGLLPALGPTGEAAGNGHVPAGPAASPDGATPATAGGGAVAGEAPATEVEAVGPESFLVVRLGGMDGHVLMLGSDVRVTPGASGGPLLECDRGEVVGIVKSSHRVDMVACAEPVSLLRALTPDHLLPGAPGLGDEPYHALMGLHDQWHWSRQRLGGNGQDTWVDAQGVIMGHRGRLWGVLERLQALALLARLPPPSTTLEVRTAVTEALAGKESAGAWSLRTWRDGHGALYQGHDAYAELRSFVHYLRIVAEEAAHDAQAAAGAATTAGEKAAAEAARAAAADLARFVEEKGLSLNGRDRERIGPVRRRPASVLVEFEPLLYSGDAERFNWSVSEGYGDGRWEVTELYESAEGLPFEQAEAQLLRRLGPRLRQADAALAVPGPHPAVPLAGGETAGPAAHGTPGGRVRLEVAVPEGHWHLAADGWALPASTRRTARARPIGASRQVVLRDPARREQVDPAWRERWRRLREASALVALRVGPRVPSPAGGEEAARLLAEAVDGAVPVLCRTVARGAGLDAVADALDTGHGVGLWYAGGHDERGCDAACDLLHERLRDFLAGCGGVVELPERVRELRARAAESDAPWARDLVLLYDDPDNPLPELFGRGARPSA